MNRVGDPALSATGTGSLPGGRRIISTMRSPHPLLHMGYPPLCSNDTRSGEGFGCGHCVPGCCCLSPTGQSKSVIRSPTLMRRGVLVSIRRGSDRLEAFAILKGGILMKTATTTARPFTTKTLAYCALLAALSVVLARFLIPMPNVTTRFSIEAVPIFLAGMLFGPMAGGLVGFSADLVGCLFSGYGYNPLFCLPPILYGVFGGVFRRYLAQKFSPSGPVLPASRGSRLHPVAERYLVLRLQQQGQLLRQPHLLSVHPQHPVRRDPGAGRCNHLSAHACRCL